MPTLPVPMMVAIILLYLLFRMKWRGNKWCWTQSLVLVCALQALIVTGRLYYQLPGLGWIQPITAAAIPPLFYLAFTSSAIRALNWPRDAWHLIAPGFTAFCVIFAPVALDGILPLIFCAYGFGILVGLRGGSDRLTLERLEEGNLPLRLWFLAAFFLFFSAGSDLVIAADLQLTQGEYLGWITVLSSSVTLLGIGLIGLSRPDPTDEAAEKLEPDFKPSLHGTDHEILEKATHLLEDQHLYRNPDLTLSSLARRLTLPAKDLSAAINRLSGMNMSQFVNGYRITEACSLLKDGQSVTEAMLTSGFQTKSNFNREFRRVTGLSPTGWVRAEAAIPPHPSTVSPPADSP